MPRKYTSTTILKKLEEASSDISNLYKSKIIKYNGTTTDTGLPYIEIIAKWLLENIELLEKIKQVTRRGSYCVGEHNGICKGTKRTNRAEEYLAKELAGGKEYAGIGKVFDYQVPLKNTNDDKGVGKIDLVSYDKGKKVYLLELKRPDNIESLLRCALEAYTYWKQLDHDKFIADYQKAEKIKEVSKIVPAILVWANGVQRMQYDSAENKSVRELIEHLEIEVFVLDYSVSKVA